MARLRIVLGLSTFVFSTVTAGSLSNSNKQAALAYLPPFGICHDISGDSTSRICPVYALQQTNQSTSQPNTDRQTSTPPPSQESQPPEPQPQTQSQSPPATHKQQTQQKKEENTQPKKEERKGSPWSRGAVCRRVGQDDFCAFTHSTFNNGEGISIITTPLIFVGLSSQAPLNAAIPQPKSTIPTGDVNPPYKDISVPGKGIGLVAIEPIRSGKRIMARTPAVMVDDRAFRGLRRDDLALLLAQAILPLPETHRNRFLNLSSSHDSHASGAPGGGQDPNEDAKAQAKKQVDLIYQIFTTNAFKTTVKFTMPEDSPQQPPESSNNGSVGDKKVKDIDFHSTFTEVSRLNHDCAPNLGYYFDSTTLSHKVYAVKDIYPGEELSVSYVDVLHPRETRKKLLKATWGFDCSCERCGGPNSAAGHNHDDTHLLEESDSRVEQLNAVRRELDNYATTSSPSPGTGKTIGTGTPSKALLLITLYQLEGAEVRIYEAYYRAALEYNGVGDATNAMIYARMCLDKGLIARGPDRPFITSMQALIRDPTKHWSWRFRLAAGNITPSPSASDKGHEGSASGDVNGNGNGNGNGKSEGQEGKAKDTQTGDGKGEGR